MIVLKIEWCNNFYKTSSVTADFPSLELLRREIPQYILVERIHKDFCPDAAGLLFWEFFLNGLSYSAFFFGPGDFMPIKTMFQRERRHICSSIYFLTQGSNLNLLHWQADSLPLSHQECL